MFHKRGWLPLPPVEQTKLICTCTVLYLRILRKPTASILKASIVTEKVNPSYGPNPDLPRKRQNFQMDRKVNRELYSKGRNPSN